MLQKLRDQTQSFGFKVLVGVIVFVLAVFGFGAANLFVDRDPAIASVDGFDITQNMLIGETERERRRIAAQLGPDFDPSLIDPARLQNVVIDRLISKALLNHAARDLGLTASESSINRVLIENPNFQIDGEFDPGMYRQMVRAMGYAPQSFQEATRESMVLDQLQNGISETAILADWELKQTARLVAQRRDLAYLAFTQESFADQVEVTDEAIAIRYEEDQLQYMTPETVDIEFVELTLDDLLSDPSIQVSEEELLAAYDADKALAPPDELRASRHILLQVTDERTAEAAERELGELKQRIENGESFAQLAREHSEDPGSAESGGELGSVGKGVFDPEFERVLFDLDTGAVSEPVRTEFGYHLILLEGIESTPYPEFDELRDEIELRLAREATEALFIEKVRELDSLAFENEESLSAIVSEFKLELQTAMGISRTSGPGIFGNQELRNALYASDVLGNGFNTAAVQYVEDRAVVARVVDRHDPEPIALEEVTQQIRLQLVAEEARALIEDSHTGALARVEAGESVSQVARDYALNWQTLEQASRITAGHPREVIEAAFNLMRPATGSKSVGEAANADGERFVVTVTRIVDGDVSTMTDSELAGIENLIANRSANHDFDAFYSTLEQQASINRPN